MTNLFIVYLAAVVIPVFFPSWRVAVLGLGLQGLMLSFILLVGHEVDSVAVVVEFLGLLLIRAVFLPWYLFRKSGAKSPREFTLVGTSLGQRSLVFLLLIAGFLMGLAMGRDDLREVIQIGTSSSSLLIGMLMVANRRVPAAQLVGLCTFEGGSTLVELLSPHAMPFPVRVGVSVIDVFFVVTCGQYLARLPAIWSPSDMSEREGA